MITCKEDLINTYIENDFGELRHLYINKAIELGFAHPNYKDRESDWYDLGYIGICTRWGDDMIGQTDHYVGGLKECECRKLTLSDLKPRTKVEYELIKFESTAGAYRAMLDGEKLYSQDGESEFLFDGKNFVGIDSDGGVYTLECHSDNEPFYRKVERPVEWFDDVLECLEQNRQSGSCDE